ncbi:substrate-binding domain-containing protein [uncultured Oscillibacter sp.]|uniref:substrate-binding domain-containing protein n=1 Tax=uncultured Oscillibacter sp. TaxID=876091 RepID=UPI0025E2D250|nr:substrate-binding domain-containing protein [uncultured Oscillibacter sp.]
MSLKERRPSGPSLGGSGSMRRAVCLLAVLLVLLPALSACGTSAPRSAEERYVVGVVTKSGSSEYWMTLRRGMETAAAELGMDLVILSPDSEERGDVQSKMAESLVKREVDVIAVSPIDSYRRPRYFDMAEERGIPVISYDTGFAELDVPYIGIDNHQAGRDLASHLAEALGHRGEVGIVTGGLEQLSHRQRMEGFIAYMETEPEMRVVFMESGYSNLQMSEVKIRRIRAAHPRMEGIAATSAVTALGIAEGLENDAVKIASIDIQKDAVEAVRDGRITALIAQSGYEIGYRTIQYIDRMRRGTAEDAGEILEAGVLTAENAESYMEREYQE